jgi:GNAT superfamily N-acetyltransferase
MPVFSDLALARRLEAAEGYACAQFARARRKLFPDCGSEAVRMAGADVVFDGVDAPTTQTFGLGMLEAPTAEKLAEMERFFEERGAAAMHEVSPFAGVATFDLLCERGYRPIEISNVLYREIGGPDGEAKARGEGQSAIETHAIGAEESSLWAEISARGWSHDHPELEDFLREFGGVLTAREGSVCFLASVDGVPGAAGSLAVHGGVALLAGAATAPELRRRGLQTALLRARLDWAREHGCDLAMMVTEAGSNSQRNAERAGFGIAYTRMKWMKQLPAACR